MRECPTSAIPNECWDAVEVFWLCHARVPGLAGWTVQRTGYPASGTPLEQDNWVIWAFRVIEAEFYNLQSDLQGEQARARELEAAHRRVQAEQRQGK